MEMQASSELTCRINMIHSVVPVNLYVSGRIHIDTVVLDFKVTVRTGASSGIADCRNVLSLEYALSYRYIQRIAVCI